MIPLDAPDSHLPVELRKQIEAAVIPHAQSLRKQLNTPVPGNPQGGFPGLHVLTERRQIIKAVRIQLIETWNAEHPDYEYLVPDPLEKPLTQQEIETKIREARARPRMVKLDPTHEAHIEEVLKGHPEEHHGGLREFIKHETNTYGLKPQQYYFRRAATLDAIQAKGKDPHNLMHRYEHHLEVNAENADNSETPNA